MSFSQTRKSFVMRKQTWELLLANVGVLLDGKQRFTATMLCKETEASREYWRPIFLTWGCTGVSRFTILSTPWNAFGTAEEVL